MVLSMFIGVRLLFFSAFCLQVHSFTNIS